MSGPVDTGAGPAVLDVTGLNAHYGRAHILRNVSLRVEAGEAVALMGRNGAGKSTSLKAIMGLVPVSSGSVRLLGEDIAGLPPYRISRAGLGYVPEDRRIFTDLTVEENLMVGYRPPPEGRAEWTLERLFELFPNLAETRARSAARISGGEQQMLSVARTLMGHPLVILLDEPSEGLAPVIVEQMALAINALKEQGLSILLSEQNLTFAERICERAYLLEAGAVAYEGPLAALSRELAG